MFPGRLIQCFFPVRDQTAAMADMKLVYFEVRGRAEIIRWICKQADIPFTDERVKKEDWPEKKKSE